MIPDLENFAKELNTLCAKYRLRIVGRSGPLLFLDDDKYGTDFSAHSIKYYEENPQYLKNAMYENKRQYYCISEPWGG